MSSSVNPFQKMFSKIISILNRPILREVLLILMLLIVNNNLPNKRLLTHDQLYISSDGRGYYEYLPATFIYKDLHFNYLDELETDQYSKEYNDNVFPVQPEIGHRLDKYFVGTAVLQSPFFAVAHVIASSEGSIHPADGYSLPYQKSIFCAAVFYLFLGLVGIHKLLKTYSVSGTWIFILQVGLIFATPLLNYTIFESAFSHVYSFFLITWFLYYLRAYFTKGLTRYLVVSIVVFGAIATVRPINILILLFAPLLTDSLKAFYLLVKQMILKHYKALLLGCVFAAVIVSLQLLTSYAQTGNPLSYNYGEEGFNFLNPHIFEFLFSYQKGFFLWTPYWFFIFLFGIIAGLLQRKTFVIAYSLFAFIALVYVLSSWHMWTYGASIGARPMVDFYAAFILIFLPVLQSRNRIAQWIFIPITIATSVLMQIQTYQYQLAIIHWDEMNKEKYWKVFLLTDKKYGWYLWRDEPPVGKALYRTIVVENQHFEPTVEHDIYFSPTVKIDSLSTQATYGQLFLEFDRELQFEYLNLYLLDENKQTVDSMIYVNLFHYHQKTNNSRYRFKLNEENKSTYQHMRFSIHNAEEQLQLKKAVFSIYEAPSNEGK